MNMNWQYVLMSIFGFSIYFVVVITILFYLQHRLVRLYRRAERKVYHPNEGRYFRRFIPLELKGIYDEKLAGYLAKKKPRFAWLEYKLHFIVIVIAIGFAGRFFAEHWYEFISPIDLTSVEYERLDKIQYQSKQFYLERLPEFKRIITDLRQFHLVLLSPETVDSPEVAANAIMAEARKRWDQWAAFHKIRTVHCEIAKWPNCARTHARRIVVVLPGAWDTQFLDHLAKSGDSFILFAAPTQVLQAGQSWSWHGLNFESFQRSTWPHLVLSGDRPLTLGFDSGLQLAASPFLNNFRVKAEAADGYAIGPDRVLSGTRETRLTSLAIDESRVVYMDFSPNAADHPPEINRFYLDAVVASAFRFLLKKEYGTIASWPEGTSFAAFVNFNMDDEYERTKKVEKFIRASSFPVTWFLVSDYVQRQPRLTRKLASMGEIGCAADSRFKLTGDSFDQQIRRLARCRKVLNQVTGQRITGLHPPQESYNDETVASLINANMKYLFAKLNFDRLVPAIRVAEKSSIVLLPRVTSDDYNLLETLNLSHDEAKERVKSEIAWVQELGGLYSYSFSSHFSDVDAHLQLVTEVVNEVKTRQAYFRTAQDIVSWWIVRRDLIEGKTPDPDLIAKYRPQRIFVRPDGILRRENL